MEERLASSNFALWLNTTGLFLGVAGAIGLGLLTKVFITINEDGTQTWGPPTGMNNEEWKQLNVKLRRKQKVGVPVSYGAIALGFMLQLVALWLPLFCS